MQVNQQEPIKILFLDVDGVLNNRTTLTAGKASKPKFKNRYLNLLEPECIKHLAHIIEQTGCRLVLHSSWRHKISCDQLAEMLEEVSGISFKHVFMGSTGIDPSMDRAGHISTWLRDNELTDQPHCILDDYAMDIPNLIQTSWQTGLNEETAEAAIKLLMDIENA